MRKAIISLAILSLIGCRQMGNEYRYTSEQVASMELDKTKGIERDSGAVINIDLNEGMDNDCLEMTDLIDTVVFIPLETNEESLIGRMEQVFVTEGYVYVQTGFGKGSELFVFDIEGNFVNKIRQGQGPGEVYRIYDVAYDRYKKQIVLYDHPYLAIYDEKGDFVERKRLPFGFFSFEVTEKGYVFKTDGDHRTNGHMGELSKQSLLVTDKDFKVQYAALPHLYSSFFGTQTYLHDNGETLMLTECMNDTVYEIVDNKLKPRYRLDYSDHKITANLEREPNAVLSDVEKEDAYMYDGSYYETSTHQMFYLYNLSCGMYTYYLRDKASHQMQSGHRLSISLEVILPTYFPIGSTTEYFISSHFPESMENNEIYKNNRFITGEVKEKMLSLDEESNPVLVLFKFKPISE